MMGPICNENDQLIGLRVVDGGKGFVGTVVAVTTAENHRIVEIIWDSGVKSRIRDREAHDLHVLDNSCVGVKHPGKKCRECNQEDISGLRWQCIDCPEPINLCTFCFTNGKHDQRHVNFRRFDQPSSDPVVVRLELHAPMIRLEGIFPGACVKKGEDWQYVNEDLSGKVGTVVSVPKGRERKPGRVWVQRRPDIDDFYSYRVGFNGKVDLEVSSTGFGGHYQPHNLPILKISEPKTDKKTNDVIVMDLPLVVGDTVKFVVGLEELREMAVDCGLVWTASKILTVARKSTASSISFSFLKDVVTRTGTITKINERDATIEVKFINQYSRETEIYHWAPEKAMRRLIPWLPVGAVVQVSNESDLNIVDDLTDDGKIKDDFGRVKKVNLDGKTVEMEIFTSGGVVKRTISVSEIKKELIVNISVVAKVHKLHKDISKVLSEVDKGAVDYLLKFFPFARCFADEEKKDKQGENERCEVGPLEFLGIKRKRQDMGKV